MPHLVPNTSIPCPGYVHPDVGHCVVCLWQAPPTKEDKMDEEPMVTIKINLVVSQADPPPGAIAPFRQEITLLRPEAKRLFRALRALFDAD